MYFLLFLFIRNIFVELNKRTWTPSSSFETTTESNINVPKGN